MSAWHKRKAESIAAFNAFQHYLQHGSIDAAYARANPDRNRSGKRAPAQWFQWSSKHEWVSRATAYAEHLAEQNRQLWERRRAELLERDWAQADELRRVVDEAIPHANQFIRRQTTTIRGRDGAPDREIITVQFDITGLAMVLEKASKLQRLATDEPTEHTKLSGAALDAFIAGQLARLGHGGETGPGLPSEPDAAETDTGPDADVGSL